MESFRLVGMVAQVIVTRAGGKGRVKRRLQRLARIQHQLTRKRTPGSTKIWPIQNGVFWEEEERDREHVILLRNHHHQLRKLNPALIEFNNKKYEKDETDLK